MKIVLCNCFLVAQFLLFLIMSKKDKLLERLLSKPKDFTFKEAETLLKKFGYESDNKGKTSGSRVRFINNSLNHSISMHRPHPKNILKYYQVLEIINELKIVNLI